MGRKPRSKCAKNCLTHRFSMKPINYFAYISRGVEASFCPQTLKHHPTFPFFNKDCKYYTSSFCLKEDEVPIKLTENKYKVNDASYHREHEKLCLEQLNGKSEMLVPKPRSKYSQCNVCKEEYDDYAEHINSQTHRFNIQNNKFTDYINELISQKFSSLHPTKELHSSPVSQEVTFEEKEICSSTTLSFSSLEEMKQNRGFTFVASNGDFEIHGNRIHEVFHEVAVENGDNGNQEFLSPQFQNLVRRCSVKSLPGSEKKSPITMRFPIIISPIE